MPTSSALRFLLRTYTWEAGSSPTRITASVGRAPVDSASAATPVFTSASTVAATALPSRVSTGRSGSGGDGDAQALDGQAPAGVGIDADHDPVERRRTLGGLEAVRHLGEEALQRQLRIDADHRVGGPGHPEVRDIGGALRQQALIRRLHVPMGADD